MKNIAFLFSGRGSLIESVVHAINSVNLEARLSLVLTNNPNFSQNENILFKDIPVIKVCNRDFSNRDDFEKVIVNHLNIAEIDLIILGGFRRILSPNFVKEFGHMTMNTHPSLLPAFPGDKAQLRALESGCKVTGATLHFINDEVDAGPIIDQEPVRINNNMTLDNLRESIIFVEKKMISKAVIAFLEGRLKILGNKVIYEEDKND